MATFGAAVHDLPPAVGDSRRLEALRRLALLDTPPEEAFDHFTRLAARQLGVPMALLSLVDADRQFFKSQVGLSEPWASRREAPLTHSLCPHVVATGRPLLIGKAPHSVLPAQRQALAAFGAVSFAGVPLTTRDGVTLGSLAALDVVPRQWSDDDLDLLNGLAAAVTTEMELRLTLRAARETEAALQEQTETVVTINQTGQLLTAELDLERLVQAVTDAATRLTGAQFGAFFYNVTDERGERYTLYAISGVSREHFSRFPMPRNTQIFDPTFRGEGVVRADDITKDSRYGQNAPYFGMPKGHLPVVSYLAVPVISRTGAVLGGLFFGHSRSGVFTEQVEQLVVGLAAQTAVAMDNAQLFEAEQRSRRAAEEASARMARLQAVMAALAGALTPEQVAQALIKDGFPALDAAGGIVAVLDEAGQTFDVLGWEGYPDQAMQQWQRFPLATPVPVAEAVRERRPILMESAQEAAERYPSVPVLRQSEAIGAFAALPLLVGDRAVGAMSLRFRGSRTFSEADRAMMRALADQGALALDRARLFHVERQSRQQAEQAVRARDEFLSVSAHELKTPMTSLRAVAQLGIRRLQRQTALTPQQMTHVLSTIDQQTGKLSLLVNQLLDVSRLQSGRLVLERTPTDLVALVETAAAAARMLTERHTITVQVPTPVPVLAEVDALRIEQVLNNLLTNAIKYSPAGPIVVTVERLDVSSVQEDSSGPAGRGGRDEAGSTSGIGRPRALARVAVWDHGEGIAPEYREAIFRPYFQAHAASHRSGMGLGLYICRQIVELHQGTISAEFPADGGTRFVVTLPLATDT